MGLGPPDQKSTQGNERVGREENVADHSLLAGSEGGSILELGPGKDFPRVCKNAGKGLAALVAKGLSSVFQGIEFFSEFDQVFQLGEVARPDFCPGPTLGLRACDLPALLEGTPQVSPDVFSPLGRYFRLVHVFD